MLRFARSTLMFGSVLLLGGVLWVAAIVKGFVDIWPAVLDKPLSAFAAVGLGIALIVLGRRIGPTHAVAAHDLDGSDDDVVPNQSRLALNRLDFRDMLQDMSAIRAPAPQAPDETVQDGHPEPVIEDTPPQDDPVPVEGPVSIAMAAFARMQEDPALPFATDRAENPATSVTIQTAFHAMLPAQPGDSWVGGAPRMPVSMEWPVLNDKPAFFMAQIALSDLAPELWNGHGPRDGWLLLFCAADPTDGIAVLHSTRPGQVRTAPKGAPLPFEPRSAAARLAHLTGAEAPTAPRLMLEPSQGPQDAAPVSDTTLADILQDAKLDDPALYPFDWTSAFALLDALTSALRRDLKQWETAQAPGLDPKAADAARDARMMVLARLRLIARQTEQASVETPFDEDATDDLLSALAELTTEGWAEGKRADTVLSMPFFRGYRAVLESHARDLASTNPDALPKALNRALGRAWQAEASRPILKFGGASNGATVTLAELRPGPLTGWPKAMRRPMRIVIPRRALQSGAFEAARLAQPRSTRTEPTE